MTQRTDPFDWAELQSNLGVTLSTIAAAHQDDTHGYAAARDAFAASLEVYTETETPRPWAIAELDLADALKHLDKLDDAVVATKAALRVFTADKTPLAWAEAQDNLGVLLHDVAVRDGDTGVMAKAADAYHAALQVFTMESTPQLWAQANTNLGIALIDIALETGNLEAAQAATDALSTSLTVYDKKTTFSDWLNSESTLANAMLVLGVIANDPKIVQSSIDEHLKLLSSFTLSENPERWDFLQKSLKVAKQFLGH